MLAARLAFDADPPTAGAPVRVELVVENGGPGPQTLVFPTAQRFELEIGSWRFGAGRLFAALREQVVLQPAGRFTAELVAVLDLPPGSYTARARLTAEGPPVTAEAVLRLVYR